MSKAIDEVRADESKELKKKGKDPLLTKSRWCLLKRPEKLTEKQVERLKDLLACNLRTVRAYLLKEDFQLFWRYSSPAWADKFLDAWCTRTMRSKIKPMKKIAKMLRAHRPSCSTGFAQKIRLPWTVWRALTTRQRWSPSDPMNFPHSTG
nr:transposase [uncultured Desulfobulbus sp.]